MRSRKTRLAHSLILTTAAIALSSAAVFAAKPPKNLTTADLYLAPATPPCTGLTEVTGIYQDGNGIYLPNEGVGFSGEDLNIRPSCAANRRINALLPAAALGQLTGPMGSCLEAGSVLLKIPALLNAQSGVVGLPSPPNPVFDSVHYYFLVDTNGNGKFALNPDRDNSYNLVWQSGIWLTRTEYFDRTVYALTTDMTSHNAELFLGPVSKGTFCVPLRLTATRMK